MPRTARTQQIAPSLPADEVADANALQAAGADGAALVTALQDAGSAGVLVGRYHRPGRIRAFLTGFAVGLAVGALLLWVRA